MKDKEYEFYDQIKDWDFSKFNITTEKLTNWDMYEILNQISQTDDTILDLGTGGGEKVLNKFPTNVKQIIATDYSESMINTANKNLKQSIRKNIEFRIMDNLNMNTPDNYFNIVVARNTVTDSDQIYKTLKPGGRLLIHGVDKYDCYELKRIFGKGQGYNDTTPISLMDYESILNSGFKNVELIPIYTREYFQSKNDLINFLLKVPIIEDFSNSQNKSVDYYKKEIDENKIDEYIKANTYPEGIRLARRYYGIIGIKLTI